MSTHTADIQPTPAERYDDWYLRWHGMIDCKFRVPGYRPQTLRARFWRWVLRD